MGCCDEGNEDNENLGHYGSGSLPAVWTTMTAVALRSLFIHCDYSYRMCQSVCSCHLIRSWIHSVMSKTCLYFHALDLPNETKKLHWVSRWESTAEAIRYNFYVRCVMLCIYQCSYQHFPTDMIWTCAPEGCCNLTLSVNHGTLGRLIYH